MKKRVVPEVPQIEIREVPSKLGGDFVQPSPLAPIQIQTSEIRGVPRGYRGDDVEMRKLFEGQSYAGPTKRSADVNDYTALEAELAKLGEENVKLLAALDASRKREIALVARLGKLDALAEEVRLYEKVRDARATKITPNTPIAAIDAALEWQERAKQIADKVVEMFDRKTGGSR